MKTKMKNREIVDNILFILLCVLMCSGYTILSNKHIKIYIYTLVFVLLYCIVLVYKNKKMVINKKAIPLIFLSIYLLIDYLFLSKYSSNTLFYYLPIWTVTSIMLINQSRNLIDKVIKGFQIFSYIEIFSILIELLTKHKIIYLFAPFYTSTRFQDMIKQAERGYYVGYVGEKAFAAFFLLIGLAIYLANNIYYKKQVKVTNVFAISLYLFAIILTAKRTIIVFSILLIFFVFIKEKYKDKFITIIKYSSILVLVCILVYKFIPAIQLMITRFANSAEDIGTMNSRTDMWNKAIKMFLDSPINGWGWGSYTFHNNAQFEAHNIYLQIIGETGILGTIFWLILIIYGLITAIYNYVKFQDNLSKIVFYIQVISLAYGLTENVLYVKAQLLVYLFTFACLPFCGNTINKYE